MNTGSISSKESDVNNVQDDDKLPALPLAMRSDDPILDTYDAWQRDITSMPPLEFPGMKDPPPLTFLHRHTSFEDFNENGTTTPTNNNSPNNDIRNHRIPSPLLKMPYDDILRTHDAEEACVDGERLPIMSSVFPHSVCLPNLDDQQHEQTAASIINMNYTDHLFQQTNNNNAAGGFAFDRNAIPPTYNSISIIAATSISLSTTADRNHRNSTSCEANANYDSPTRPILEDHPAIVTQSEITEFPAHIGAVAEVNILPHEDQVQSEVKELSSEMNVAKTAGYGLVHYSPNSDANHTKTPVASPVSSTTRPPTVTAVIGSEEGSVGQARIRKSDQDSIDPWLVKFNLLKKYKAEHNGSCDVPQKDPLGAWVNKQRMEHKALVEGKIRSSMTVERRRHLESIDFKWAEQKGQVSWEKRFSELVAYKSETGHCDFPTKSKDNSALGRWITTQRSAKKNGDITKNNERRLNEIEFAWDRHHKQPKKRKIWKEETCHIVPKCEENNIDRQSERSPIELKKKANDE